MPKVAFREEVVNVALAELLEQRGMLSVPETIRKSIARKTRDLPDIIVADLLGIRMVIEGRFNGSRAAGASLLKDARERVEQGISPVCLAVLYPPELRSAESLPRLRLNLEKATLTIRVISENSDGEWADGTVDDIVETLRRSYVEFGAMNLYTLPIGGRQTRLGSLDLLTGEKVSVQADLFGAAAAPARVSGKGEIKDRIALPQPELCVMNPPFTRSVGGNLLFGHAPPKERARMQAALKKIVADEGIPANITAGLGSVFVALGHLRLASDGRLALVLPRALLSGVAWQETRRLIGNNYHLKYVIVSHQPGSWNFSENTELSECLIIAKRARTGDVGYRAKVVNLWTKPKSSVEAPTVASLIRRTNGASLDDLSGSDELSTPTQKYGEVILCSREDAKRGNWNEGAVFAQTELCRAAHFLKAGKVFVPGSGILGVVPITRFKSIADIGPDRRDIHDGFRMTDQDTEYPAYWGHDTESAQTISQRPNRHLIALSRAKKGRNLRDAHLLWSRSGGLLVAERLWLLTTRVFALKFRERVLSNTWWPVALHAEGEQLESLEKMLSLWFNSTLGILSLIAARVDTRGAWVELKKPVLEELSVFDPRKLGVTAQAQLCETYDEVSALQVQALPAIDSDPVHSRIDGAFAAALGINDDLGRLRRMLAREPVVSMRLPSETTKSGAS